VTVGWERRGWRTAIARVSDRIELRPPAVSAIDDLDWTVIRASRPGTLTVADVIRDGATEFTIASVYAPWECLPGREDLKFADASAHRLLSDLSALVWPRTAPVMVAGDLNILYGYGDYGHPYWARRYGTVFERAEALGFTFVGPQHPNGRRAEPWPSELPPDSLNVPTYHTRDQGPAGATRQMDFVFATEPLRDRVTVRALNDPDEWGPSDHCRILIEVAD
jgi:exonuclease III